MYPYVSLDDLHSPNIVHAKLLQVHSLMIRPDKIKICLLPDHALNSQDSSSLLLNHLVKPPICPQFAKKKKNENFLGSGTFWGSSAEVELGPI